MRCGTAAVSVAAALGKRRRLRRLVTKTRKARVHVCLDSQRAQHGRGAAWERVKWGAGVAPCAMHAAPRERTAVACSQCRQRRRGPRGGLRACVRAFCHSPSGDRLPPRLAWRTRSLRQHPTDSLSFHACRNVYKHACMIT